jgi:hypothetical protein
MPDEDDRWFEALAGEGKAATPGDPSTEGAALRAAILARAVSDAGEVPETDPRREAQLLERARAAGLLPATPPAAPERTKHRTLRWLALAAVLTCIAVGISLQMRPGTPTVVLRGDAGGLVRIRASDPLRLKQDLLRELNAAGVQATGYENLGRQGIDADLPQPVPDAVRNILQRHAIPLPTGTVLQLEIEAQSTP